ncbi:MAG: hypothetical protein IPK78_10835 [Rhodospirillales bacterium]|nr:hypothetical protein [Rhodospirillales bacterium]
MKVPWEQIGFGYTRSGRQPDDRGSLEVETVKPCVLIHINPPQTLGALVPQYALHRNWRRPKSFHVRILSTGRRLIVGAREGQTFKRYGVTRIRRNDDLQSFTPLRFLPPEAMDYAGRARMPDPDFFAVAGQRSNPGWTW